nr:MAG TPA: hypothetical protein [Caudoviricetes sp.]
MCHVNKFQFIAIKSLPLFIKKIIYSIITLSY